MDQIIHYEEQFIMRNAIEKKNVVKIYSISVQFVYSVI